MRNGVAHRDASLQGAILAAVAGKTLGEQESKLSEKVKEAPKKPGAPLQALEAQVSSLEADKLQLEQRAAQFAQLEKDRQLKEKELQLELEEAGAGHAQLVDAVLEVLTSNDAAEKLSTVH